MSCNFTLTEHKFGKSLQQRFGSDVESATAIWNAATDGNGFNKEFIDFVKTKRNLSEDFNPDTANGRTIVNDMIDYYNRQYPDGSLSIINQLDDASAPYGGASNRDFCIARVSDEINDIFRENRFDGNYQKKTKEEYLELAKYRFFKRLYSRAFPGKKIPYETYKTLDNNTIVSYIDLLEKALGENRTNQDDMLIATIREAYSNSDEFFNKVFDNSKLQSISKEFKQDSVDEDEKDEVQATEGLTDATNGQQAVKDDNYSNLMFRVMESHSGEYATFTTHIGGSLNSYFNSLRKCKSANKRIVTNNGKAVTIYDYDTNNIIGIAECFTAQECASILYTRSYNSMQDFLDTVKQIYEQYPGYEGFVVLYDDMTNNADFAAEVYQTFKKYVTSKKEIFRDENGLQVRLTNNASSKLDALRLQYLNSVRSTAISLNYPEQAATLSSIDSLISKLEKDIKIMKKPNEVRIKETETLLAKALSEILPEVSESVILNYVDRNKSAQGEINRLGNIKSLRDSLKYIIDTSKQIAIAYNDNIESLSRKRHYNDQLTEQVKSGLYVSDASYKDTSEELAFDPTSGNDSYILDLANKLVKYTDVKVELNSRNAAGNLSSDVLNNSMISNLKEILTSELNSQNSDNSPINRFAEYKFRTKQYNLSNILVEHKDINKNIINYGLFKEINGKYVPTEYFDKLLKFSLFNGVSDTTTGSNALYADCTLNDYFATAFESYMRDPHRENDNIKDENKEAIMMGTYFMRTPSDAPKNYYFTAPRYRTSDLLTVDKQSIYNIIDNIKVLSTSEANAIINTDYKAPTAEELISFNTPKKSTVEVNDDTLVKVIAGSSVDIVLDKQERRQDGDKTIVALENNGVIVYVKGDVTTKAKTEKLTNIEFLGVKQNKTGNTVKFAYPESLYNKLVDEYTKQYKAAGKISINRDSAIFKQMQNIFKQEMQDAATAISKLFVNTNGVIALDEDGQPLLQNSGKTNLDMKDCLYLNYHWNGKQIVDNSDIKRAKLTGKVFSSDKFTLFKDGNPINYMDEIFDDRVIDETEPNNGTINFLYGAANGSHLQIDLNGDVVLTDAQQNKIDEAIEKFLIDYIDTSLQRSEKYKEVLDSTSGYNEEDIIDFVINYRLAYYGANDLFEGDVKFYKSTQDFLKRAKEAQAGGVPYAITDLTKPYFNQEHVEIDKALSYLNSDKIQQRLNNIGLNVKAYTTFKGVTVYNTVRTDKETINRLAGRLYRKFINIDKFDKNVAQSLVRDIMEGYKNIKTNDAQSYITFEEWIRRVAGRGQLAKYMPLIERIQDRTQPLSPTDLQEFIQVQKNFYYDMQYDETTGVMAPRQIKNAEFVLVPRLIEGTELEAVYQVMKENDIDQLNTIETSKAGKARVIHLWDNEGNLTDKALNNFKLQAKEASEIYDYNYLYTQQETPQHLGVNAENKFGLQISKKVLDNIPKGHPLYKHKEAIQNALCSNIKSSWRDLLTDLGIKVDDDAIGLSEDELGNLTIDSLNTDAILDKFKNELVRTGINSNLADYVTKVPGKEAFDTLMPFYISSVGQKMENIAQSVFNRSVTRQKLPGFHAAQITRVGFKDWKAKHGEESYPKELRDRPTIDGQETGYIEVMLPYSAFGIDPNDERYEGMTKAEKDAAILKMLEAKGLDKVIGYRIPTEAKMSSQVMKIVGFIPSEYGSTIVVPDDWVAITGSDFDIDSVYGIQYKHYTDKNGVIRKVPFITNDKKLYIQYVLNNVDKKTKQEIYETAKLNKDDVDDIQADNQVDNALVLETLKEAEHNRILLETCEFKAKKNGLKSFEEHKQLSVYDRNTRDARNNHIIDNMISILESDETLNELLTQSNFRAITGDDGAVQHVMGSNSAVAKQRRSRSAYDFFDQAESFEDASAGMALKGISVAGDTFVSVCNTVQPVLRNGITVTYNYKNLSDDDFDKKVIEAKKRFGETNVNAVKSNKTINVTHKQFGWSNDNRNIDGSLITEYSAQTTAHILDAIKEGAVPNVTIDTFNVYKLFPSMGVNFDTGIAFIMQPAITRLVANINATKSVYMNTYGSAINNTLKQYEDRLAATFGKNWEKLVEDYKNKVNVLNYKYLKARFDNVSSRPVEESIKHNTYNGLISANDDSVFVFGSNPLGINGNPSKGTGGAALVALQQGRVQQGEKMNNTISSNGRAYGLTTVKAPNARRNIENQLSIEEITNNIKKLYAYASANPNKTFKVAYTDTKLLNGHSISELVNAFINAGPIPNNVLFHSSLDKYFVKPTDNKAKQLLFDYAVIKQYQELSNIAREISSLSMVCNPDKFGAKQSIFATNKVFTDIQSLVDKEINEDSVFEGEFLTKIFPDVNLGLDGYISSKNNNSSYPSLHHYLKYATATSIKINSLLFPTHYATFEETVKSITNVFAGRNSILNEDTYNSFSNFVLNYVYKQSNIIAQPVQYVKGKGIQNVEGDDETERRRVYGFNRRSDISYLDENNKWVEFKCANVANPTEEEYNNFAKLSPAQKVFYVQKHFRNPLICKYLKVQTFNSSKYRANVAGAQTIQYLEEGTNEETLFEAFRNTYENTNPLLVLTAMDLIKYSIIVEGFKMRQHGVSKVISNKILYTEAGLHGCGFIDSIKAVVNDFTSIYDKYTIDKLTNAYVRSHPDMKEIAHTYIKPNKDESREVLKSLQFGIRAMHMSNSSYQDYAVEHNLGYDTYSSHDEEIIDETTGEVIGIKKVTDRIFNPNPYIQINYGRDKGKVLYKVEYNDKTGWLYLYPLNKLQENEQTTWSVKNENNIYNDEDFFKAVLADYIEGDYNYTDNPLNVSEEVEKKATEEKNKHRQTVNTSIIENKTINIDDPIFSKLKQQIIDHFDGTNENWLYLTNSVVEDYIVKPASVNIETGEINDNGQPITINGRHFRIWKPAVGTSLWTYIRDNNARKKPIKKEDTAYADLINETRDTHSHHLVPFIVRPADQPVTKLRSSITESIKISDRDIRRKARQGDEQSQKYIRQVNKKDIHSTTAQSVQNNMNDVVVSTAEYVTTTVENLLNGEHSLNYFCKDLVTGENCSISSSQALALIKKSPEMRRKFLKNLLDAQHLIQTYSSFGTFKYTDDEKDFEFYINKINEAIKKLENSSLLQDAERLYMNEYLPSISTNPMLQDRMMSLYDGFYITSTINSYINDLQETGNPMLQIITSDVMKDVRARELQGERRIKEFTDYIKQLNKEAAAAGYSIDWSNIVSDSGRWIDEYNEKFIEDLEHYQDAYNEAYKAYKDIEDIPENEMQRVEAFTNYLKARREFNLWKLKNVNQPLVEDYYSDMLELEETMINPTNGEFRAVYVEYSMLNDRLKDILDHASNGTIDPIWEEKRKEITYRIKNLKSKIRRTPFGDFEPKVNITSNNQAADPATHRQQILNSLDSAERLNKYYEARKKINEKYFDYTEQFGFKEQVEKYKDIVRRLEAKDPVTGKMLYTASQLAQNEEYVKAKEWFANNTLHTYTFQREANNMSLTDAKNILIDDYYGTLSEDKLKLRTAAAIRYFKNTAGSTVSKNAAFRLMADVSNAYDESGIIDATKLTDEQIKAIKFEQERKYGIGEDNGDSENRIMHSSTLDDTIYTADFWDNLKVHGLTSQQYKDVCKKLNSILRTCLNSSTGGLETASLTEDQIKEVLSEFAKLGYNPITREFNTRSGIKRRTGVNKEDVKRVKDFIKNNVDFVLSNEDKVKFDIEEAKAKAHGEDSLYYNLWRNMNYEYDENSDSFIPNHLIWGHPKLKDSVSQADKAKYIDKEKTAAIRILRDSFTEQPTRYYDDKLSQMIKDYGTNSTEFKEWYKANHIYNPHTHTMEPLVCWMSSEPNLDEGEYEPAFSMTSKTAKKDYQNENYKDKLGHAVNFKRKSQRKEILDKYNETHKADPFSLTAPPKYYDVIPDNNTYDNNTKANPYEEKLKDHVQKLLASLANTTKAQQYLERGFLPTRAKQESVEGAKGWLKELGKGFGFMDNHYGEPSWHHNISYDTDTVPDMPMLHQLTNKETVHKPNRLDYGNDIEKYNKDLEEYEKKKDDIDKKNAEIHKALIDNDWESVISEFIRKASHYNAIQANKYNLYFAQSMLNKLQMYHSDRGDLGNLNVKEIDDNEVVYDKQKDTNLQKQYDVWLHRLIYDEYKLNQGVKTKFMNLAQSITSNMYMTINLRGGIANVTVGTANIAGEVFAKEYLGKTDYAKGQSTYMANIGSYIQGAYSEKSTSLADAIIKGLNIVDYDEFRGLTNTVNSAIYAKRLRDAMYCCQTAGEHYMQNSVMFAMMYSHKLVNNPDYTEDNGQPKYILMNEEEYLRNADKLALREVCNDEEYEKYSKFLDTIKSDANVNKDYNLYRRQTIRDFIIDSIPDKAKEFRKARDRFRKTLSNEFKTYDDFYSQFVLDDGTLGFKKGSKMEEMHEATKDKEVSDAYTTLGKFKQRVISVNKKIHGNYGKLDAAQIEHKWWGAIVMQYHKHIIPGYMKRWRTKGYYNEERGTIEKGSYIALYDFLKSPIDQIARKNGMTGAQITTLKGIQTILGQITDYLHYLKLNLEVMPEYEKANMRRVMGDLGGMLVGLAIATLCRLGWDDDDDSLAFNLLLYEADRLYSENNMWNPMGAINEIKTLYSSPIAAQSWITDAMNIANTLAGVLMEGDDYDPYFRTGRYAGHNKLQVYLERRIPYWRNYVVLRDLGENNRYYKRTSSFIDTVPKAIGNAVK